MARFDRPTSIPKTMRPAFEAVVRLTVEPGIGPDGRGAAVLRGALARVGAGRRGRGDAGWRAGMPPVGHTRGRDHAVARRQDPVDDSGLVEDGLDHLYRRSREERLQRLSTPPL